MNTVLVPGTFDPPTLGHLDLFVRAAKVSQKLIIGVAQNTHKKSTVFSVEERVQLLKKIVENEPNIEVIPLVGLLVDFAKKHQINFLIRGLRAFSESEREFRMAAVNKKIGDIETLFLMADSQFAHISSSLIKEIAELGHHLKDFVPESIEKIVSARLSKPIDLAI